MLWLVCLLDTKKNTQQGIRISGLSFGSHSDTHNIVGVGVGVKSFFSPVKAQVTFHNAEKKTPSQGDSRGFEGALSR